MVAIEVKHTPGPWKIDFVHSDDLAIVPVDGRFKVLARVVHSRGGMDAQTIANAKLMAAAPLLLESLRALLNIFSNAKPIPYFSNEGIGHITDAEDAVITATLDDTRTPDEIELDTVLGF